MISTLASIKPKIEKYITMICALYDVDVDICDNDLIRIAGTGGNNTMIGEHLASGRLSKKAMEERKCIIAKAPMEEEMCIGCINRNICIERCGMTFPIIYDDIVLGAINITALSEAQETELTNEQDKFVLFMQSICDLITLTVREHENFLIQSANLKIQEKLINVINDGVLIIDENNRPEFINRRGTKILGYTLGQIQYLTSIRQFSIKPLNLYDNDLSSCRITVRGETRILTGYFHDAGNLPNGKNSRIFVFFDMKSPEKELHYSDGFKVKGFDNLIGQSSVFLDMLAKCKAASEHLDPVLLCGEPGSDLPLLARIMHNEGPLYRNDFVFIEKDTSLHNISNCTLFVENASVLTSDMSRKLMNIIEERESLNCKVICCRQTAFNSNQTQDVFMTELYYFTEANIINVPPLRARGTDVCLLAENFLNHTTSAKRKKIQLCKSVYDLLMDYKWPGNITELKNVMDTIVVHASSGSSTIKAEQLPDDLLGRLTSNRTNDFNLKTSEKNMIIKALNEYSGQKGSKALAAKKLGISTATLYRKIHEYGIEKNRNYK